MENMHIDRDVNDFISCPPFLISDFIMHKHVLICNRKSYTKKKILIKIYNLYIYFIIIGGNIKR